MDTEFHIISERLGIKLSGDVATLYVRSPLGKTVLLLKPSEMSALLLTLQHAPIMVSDGPRFDPRTNEQITQPPA